jgi:hypothetical protein
MFTGSPAWVKVQALPPDVPPGFHHAVRNCHHMARASEKAGAAICQLTYSIEGEGIAAALLHKLPGICSCLSSDGTVVVGCSSKVQQHG